MDEQGKRFKMDTSEQERTRDVSLPQHADFMSAAQQRKMDEAPSTLQQNLLGAGVDSRGQSRQQYEAAEEEFAAESTAGFEEWNTAVGTDYSDTRPAG